MAGSGDAYPSLVATGDITLNADLNAEISSEWHGVYSEKGDIILDSAKVSINAFGI